MGNIVNAKITGTFLGTEDHGIFTTYLYVDLSNGGSVGIGGYALDEYDKELECRVTNGYAMATIKNVLETVGVDSWEKLVGKYIRVEENGWGSTVSKIGNLMTDKWFDYKEYFGKIE